MHKNNKKFVLKINKIKKSFGQKVVLDDVSFSLFFGQKVALIGANGSGKSTLAKIITGEVNQDFGSVEVFKNFKISYLPQEIDNNFLVRDYLEKSSKAFEILNELKLSKKLIEEIFLRKISSLSGGEKTKIFLAKIALEKSPIIILDEPTNNLDKEGLEKLEKIINDSSSAFLIISHNREFLDQTVSEIIYLDENSHQVKIYDGGYSDFLNQTQSEKIQKIMEYSSHLKKEQKMYNAAMLRKKQQESIESVINKGVGCNAGLRTLAGKAGKDVKKLLKKYEDIRSERPEKEILKRPLKIDFSNMKHSGTKILEIKNLNLEFGFNGEINLEIVAGDRVLISGVNGSGKTTFLRTILKKSDDLEKIKWGVNVEIGYLPQDFLFEKYKDEIFIDYFIKETGKNITDARKILARFGFLEYEIKTKISKLSLGMRGRGKIATMLANNPNVLILDEPTNNLDLEVLEKFEQALKNYKGVIVFVSHDKYFIDRMKPNKVLLGL